MLRSIAAPSALLGAYHDRNRHRTAGHITKLGGLIHDLIRGHKREIHEQDLHHGPHSGHRCPDAETHEAGFADGRVTHPVRAEFVDEIFGHAKDTAVVADILAHQKDLRIRLHLLTECFVQGLSVGEGWHKADLPRYNLTKVSPA